MKSTSRSLRVINEGTALGLRLLDAEYIGARQLQKHKPSFRYSFGSPLRYGLSGNLAKFRDLDRSAEPFDKGVCVHLESIAHFTDWRQALFTFSVVLFSP